MCISIRAIRCPQLHHYYQELTKDGMSGKDAWDHVRTFLPNVGSISNAAEDYVEEDFNEPLRQVQEY